MGQTVEIAIGVHSQNDLFVLVKSNIHSSRTIRHTRTAGWYNHFTFSYQRTRLNRFGFPRGVLMRQKQVQGFQTGDRVKAVVPTGKKAGTYTGRVAVRKPAASTSKQNRMWCKASRTHTAL
jgi:hypothetical protein